MIAPILKWPTNPLTEICMTQEEIWRTEDIILYCQERIYSNLNGHNSFEYIRIKSKTPFFSEDGSQFRSPRTVIVAYHFALVVLNTKGGMCTLKGRSRQKELKYAYNALTGEYYVKKHCINKAQINLFYDLFQIKIIQSSTISIALPKITPCIEYKYQIFEEMLPMTFRQFHKENGGKFANIHFPNLFNLINLLSTIHKKYFDPTRFDDTTETGISSDYRGRCYHGNISPYTILCEQQVYNGITYPIYKLSGYEFYCNGNEVYWTKGWASPETIEFNTKKTVNGVAMTELEFNQKYGAKKDTWALVLILISILKGGLYTTKNDDGIPLFPSIINKVYDKRTGKINESGLLNLQQNEIDENINNAKNQLKKIQDDNIRFSFNEIWNCIGKCLIVDPDKRPTMASFDFIPM